MVIYKVRHAFTAIPVGKGLLSPFYNLLDTTPPVVYLRRNKGVATTLQECCIFLCESVASPTPYRSLVMGWPAIVGVTDASSQGARGIVIGETAAIPPTVFRFPWP